VNTAVEYRAQNQGNGLAPNTGKNKPFGAIERRIATRYLRAKRNQGGVGLIASISFFCIMLAIAAMIIIMSIMNGFRDEVIRLTIGSEGHIYAQLLEPSITPEDIKQIEGRIASIDGVEEAFQYTQHVTGVQANGTFGLGQVIGVRPDVLKEYEFITSKVIQGSLEGFGTGQGSDRQIAIGARLAESLGLWAGDVLTVYSPRVRSSVMGDQPIRKNYTVGAIFQVGIVTTDQSYIFMDLEQSTALFEGGELVGKIQVRLDTPDDVDRLEPVVADAIQSPANLTNWRLKNQATATALRTEQIAMRFIFMIVVIIAAFPVLASMIMLVKNKSKDIAILRTIGVAQSGILRIFLMSGAMIGVLGTFAGLIIGILFCVNIAGVQSTIEFVCQCELFPPSVYQLSSGIPVKIVWSEVFGVAFWGFLISTMATLFPALSASKIDPVDALRYE
jgi:lipoprotein-releasing system permease protein